MGWTAFLPGNNWSIFKIFFLLGTNQATEFNEPLEPLLSIHAEEEDQVFVYLYNVKISIWETQLYSYCVRRQSSKDLLPNTSALHDVVHFILFYSSRAKTTTDNDQPPFLWHGQCKLFTKVTSVCILMYKLLLHPDSWVLMPGVIFQNKCSIETEAFSNIPPSHQQPTLSAPFRNCEILWLVVRYFCETEYLVNKLPKQTQVWLLLCLFSSIQRKSWGAHTWKKILKTLQIQLCHPK